MYAHICIHVCARIVLMHLIYLNLIPLIITKNFQSTQGIGFQISAKVAALNFNFVDVIV